MRNNTYTLLNCLSVTDLQQNLIGEVRMPHNEPEAVDVAKILAEEKAAQEEKATQEAARAPADEATVDTAARQAATAATGGADTALYRMQNASEDPSEKEKSRVGLWFTITSAMDGATKNVLPSIRERIMKICNDVRGGEQGLWGPEGTAAAVATKNFKTEEAFRAQIQKVIDAAGWAIDWNLIVRRQPSLKGVFGAQAEKQIPWSLGIKETRREHADMVYGTGRFTGELETLGKDLIAKAEAARKTHSVEPISQPGRNPFDVLVEEIQTYLKKDVPPPFSRLQSYGELAGYADRLADLIKQAGGPSEESLGVYTSNAGGYHNTLALDRISRDGPESKAEAELYLETVKKINGAKKDGDKVGRILVDWEKQRAELRKKLTGPRKPTEPAPREGNSADLVAGSPASAPATPPESTPPGSADVATAALGDSSRGGRRARAALATGKVADLVGGGGAERAPAGPTDKRRLDIATGLGFSRAQLQEAFDAKDKDGAELVAAVRKGQEEVWDALSREQKKELPQKLRPWGGFVDGIWGNGSQDTLEKLASMEGADPKWGKMAKILRPEFAVRSSGAAAETRVAETAPGAGEKVKLPQARFLEKATRPLIGEEIPLKTLIKLKDKGGEQHTLNVDDYVTVVDVSPSNGKVTVTPFRGFSGERYAVTAGKLNFEDMDVKKLISDYYRTTSGTTELALMEARWRGEDDAAERIAAKKAAEGGEKEKPAVVEATPPLPPVNQIADKEKPLKKTSEG